MPIMVGTERIKKIFIGETKVYKVYVGDKLVYSSGNVVTYHVDTNVTYQEEVDEGQSVLSPKSFTPTKAGWTFFGWARSPTEQMPVSSLIMGEEPIDLYAIFRKGVILTYYTTSTALTATGNRSYNNGNEVPASITVADPVVSGWTFRGWSRSSAGNASIAYAHITNLSLSEDTTLYASWTKDVTLSYNGNGNTGGATGGETKPVYSNHQATVTPASFTVKANGFTKTGYNFVQWRRGSTSGTAVTAGATISLTGNETLYAEWRVSKIEIISPSGAINSNYVTITSSPVNAPNASGFHVGCHINQSGQDDYYDGDGTVTFQFKNIPSGQNVRMYFASRDDNAHENTRTARLDLYAKDGGAANWQVVNQDIETGVGVNRVTVTGNGTIQFDMATDIANNNGGFETYVDLYLKVMVIMSPPEDLTLTPPDWPWATARIDGHYQ